MMDDGEKRVSSLHTRACIARIGGGALIPQTFYQMIFIYSSVTV